MGRQRQPETATELARAVYYAIEQVRDKLPLPDKATDDTWAAHCILANTAIVSLIAKLEDKPFREVIWDGIDKGMVDIKVTGWHFDWWPEYPDWVFDDGNATS